MLEYLTPDYSGAPFELFGLAHILTMLIMCAFGWALILFARSRDEDVKGKLRLVLAFGLVFAEVSWHIWAVAFNEWTLADGLPFHLCTVLIWIAAVALLFQNRRLYPIIYFLALAGSLQGVLTPSAAEYGFPHFRFLQTMMSHGGLVIAGFWVVFVENYRPEKKSILHVLIGLNVYAALVYPINLLVGSNYLYVNGKPETASLLDVFPEWPWYILLLEMLALLLFYLLYLPFRKPQPVAA